MPATPVLVLPTVQDVGDISGQLHSLTGQCGFPSDTLLDKVLSVASNMTSLILYQSGRPGQTWLLCLRVRYRSQVSHFAMHGPYS